jgi:FkbM family methyltransferase
MAGRVTGAAVHLRAIVGRGQSAQGFYARRLRYGDLAFDIGANAGVHTAAMVMRGARVVAVEPQPELATALERIPKTTVVRAAISDQHGEAVLHTASAHHQHATLSDSWVRAGDVLFDGSRAVPVTTLDSLIGRFGTPRLVKIDVEGLEDRVLAGLSTPVEHVLFEMHRSLLEVAERALARLDSLGRYEYRLMPHKPCEGGSDPWVLGPVITPSEIRAAPCEWADVYAHQLPAT